MTDSIDQFIRRSNDGQDVESQGEFSISVSRALEKMSRFQLENPEDYLIKILQAGFRLQAEVMNVKIGPSWEEVRFAFPYQPDVTADNLARIAAQPLTDMESAASHLAIALAANAGKQVRWELSPGHYLEWKNERVTCLTADLPKQNMEARFSVHQRGLISGLLSLVLRGRHHKNVYDACRYSPLHVRVGGGADPKRR
jgi:hypothetical protein